MDQRHLLGAAAAGALLSSAAATPIFDTFGPLPEATFGGTGIPNDAVAASRQIIAGDVTITIALSATQRFSNPALTNDGAGTYFAGTGSNFGGAGQSAFEGALWNFNFFIAVEGANGATPTLGDFQFDLFYDFDPAADNTKSELGRIDLSAVFAAEGLSGSTLSEGSQNLLFGFLATPFAPFVFPGSGSFDPDALGEYTIGLTVNDPDEFNSETVVIDVVTVPAPAAAGVLGLAGLVGARRRR